MDFIKKNDFIVKHKKKDHFDKDLELFRKVCPASKLHEDLKRANSFNKGILDGYMLFELLDRVSPKEILKHRNTESKIQPDNSIPPPVVEDPTPSAGSETQSAETPPPKIVTETLPPEGDGGCRNDSINDELNDLKDKVEELESNLDDTQYETQNLRDDLEEQGNSIGTIKTIIDDLKKTPVSKKKANTKSSHE